MHGPAEGLSLVTQLNDFERTVHVSGSKDGQEWTPLGDGVIFDYSRTWISAITTCR